MTDNTALYEIEFWFMLNEQDVKLPSTLEYSKSEIINVYNNYGIAIPYPLIDLYGNALTIFYYNPITLDVTMAIYEL
jgi:hypothetical protein